VKKHFALIAACLVISASGICSAGQQPSAPQHVTPKPQSHAFSADATAERIVNLDALKKQVKQYHDCTCTCGCYARDLDARADHAISFLRRRAARPRAQEKLAMVLDIDETTLSNYPQLLKADFAYDAAVFDAWVKTAQAPAISGTLRLYKEAQKLGVSVFFITGRSETERDATERNLREQGIDNWQQLTMRTPETHSETTIVYKSAARAAIATQGYKIVLNVGDQWSDLKGKPEAEFSVKYPDPFYFIP
jgi:acid phosphatase